MKEIFINSARAAYSATIIEEWFSRIGLDCSDVMNASFYSRRYGIFDFSINSILLCLNLKEYKTDDYMDKYGRIYDRGEFRTIFYAKHSDEWYEKFWFCITEGKDGVEELIQEALKEVEAFEEKMEICDKALEIFSLD